ncbi:cbb3-type cytochrome oxidase subunit 3 [Roseateles sp. PN1]|uniref:cbb3-type cytochrome oxidase subunit 3 n=1 Tax=Roseateles sp. PN1 TaxID=3137372 RepID=UPI0031399E5D
MDINILRSIVTLVSMVVFLLIVGWAYSSRNKDRFDELAQLPLDEEVSGRSQ